MIAAPAVLDICGALAAQQPLVRWVGAVPAAWRGERLRPGPSRGPAAAEP